MGKTSRYICQQCGYEAGKWMGKCPECREWNSLVETIKSNKRQVTSNKSENANTNPIPLNSITSKSTARISTKIGELDRVLGGGLVTGQVVLIAGEPGIGKSTLLLQVAEKLAVNKSSKLNGLAKSTNSSKSTIHHLPSTVLYVSGEESASQIKVRADRLGIKNVNISLLETTDVDEVVDQVTVLQSYKATELLETELQRDGGMGVDGDSVTLSLNNSVSLVIVDSIQTMATSDLSGMAGSVGQVRECAYRLVRIAKERGIPIFIVGHVTKQGSVAGPSVLMHIVDTVLWFEGEKETSLRLLRSVKNRFGPTDEVGIFEMGDRGLLGVSDPERAFLTSGKKGQSGSVITVAMQGTRPVLAEIQSLVVQSKLAFPKRVSQGIDAKRVELLLAVLIRRCGMPLYDWDVYVNVTGGISLRNDPSTDLAVCMSIVSSYFDKAMPSGSVAIGEIGLLGDIKKVQMEEKRVREVGRLGYKNVITSKQVEYLNQTIKKYLR